MGRSENDRPSAPPTSHDGRERVPELVIVSRSGSVTTLALAGDLDLGTVPAVRAMLEEEIAQAPSRMILDVSAVDFVDSSGLHALVRTYRELAARGGTFELTRVPDQLRRLLEITDLAALLSEPRRDVVG